MFSAVISSVIVGAVALAMTIGTDDRNANTTIENEFLGMNDGSEISFPDGRTFRKTSNGIEEIKVA